MLGGYTLFLDIFSVVFNPLEYVLTAVLLFGVTVFCYNLSLNPSGVSYLVRPRNALVLFIALTTFVIELARPEGYISIEVIILFY